MASDFGEQVVLAGESIGDNADNLNGVTTAASELGPTIGEIALDVEKIEAELTQMEKKVRELTGKLLAKTVSFRRELIGGEQVNRELGSSVGMAHQLLEGSQNHVAQTGLDKADVAVETAGKALQAGGETRDQAAVVLNLLGIEVITSIDGTRGQLQVARSMLDEAGRLAQATKDGLTEGVEAAREAREKITQYGRSR
jgi:hypothetical protein